MKVIEWILSLLRRIFGATPKPIPSYDESGIRRT